MPTRPKPKADAPLRRQLFVEVPTRAMLFLRGVAANPSIREELASAGYTADEHAEGVRLLSALLAVSADDSTWKPEIGGSALVEELAKLGRTKLRAASIVLRRRYPADHEKLFRKLDLSDDPRFAATMFLKRIDDLDPKSAVAATLHTLGFTKELRKRLDITALPVPSRSPTATVDQKAVLALREWIDAWTSLAREALKSRESLIRLGLAARRRGADTNGQAAHPEQH